MHYSRLREHLRAIACCAAVACTSVWLAAQTPLTPAKNKYSPQEDVELGRKAADDVEKELPVLADDAVTSYVQDLGAKLVKKIPPALDHPEFHYTFKVVDVKDINAFALPGGPMFVHRGIIESAETEGELVGVMAHEMGHVALRHSTAQMTKATKFGFGQLAGAIAGAVVGGSLGEAIYQGTSLGLSTTFLKFSRGDEKQADIFGVQLMSRAGYDARDLAHMFQTIETQGGDAPPQWLSDHPNPGNRVQYINEEATHFPVSNPIHVTQAFNDIRAHLKTLPPAPTMHELAKKKQEEQQRRQRR